MVRAELAHNIAIKLDKTNKYADEILTTVLNTLIDGLKKDGDVVLRGFGRFVVQDKKERMGRNPKTGEKALIKARKRVAFKSSKNLKEFLN